jgi:hypothetical protein
VTPEYQTTFRYFTEKRKDTLLQQKGCTILPQAYHLELAFNEKGQVDFRKPQCIHCGSKHVKKDGIVTKHMINSTEDDHEFLCSHYICMICKRPTSPLLSNAFVYDAAIEGMKRLSKLVNTLEKWEKNEIDEINLTQKIYSIVNEIYTENINLPRGKNVILSEHEIKDLMIKNIIDGQCSEMSSNMLNLPGKLKKAPSADTLLMYLGRNSEKDVRSDIRKIFDILDVSP